MKFILCVCLKHIYLYEKQLRKRVNNADGNVKVKDFCIPSTEKETSNNPKLNTCFLNLYKKMLSFYRMIIFAMSFKSLFN